MLHSCKRQENILVQSIEECKCNLGHVWYKLVPLSSSGGKSEGVCEREERELPSYLFMPLSQSLEIHQSTENCKLMSFAMHLHVYWFMHWNNLSFNNVTHQAQQNYLNHNVILVACIHEKACMLANFDETNLYYAWAFCHTIEHKKGSQTVTVKKP